ncbi:MAG: SpoIID/LytB domain-containing protein [Propionibacteriales bacterium]|nr:SpoIID/LytB domain-containing protein [Propionibacteriales bacterium]
MRLIRGTLLAVLATLIPAVVVPPAEAASPTSVTLVGRGWGHGHGMSQYGAQNRAKNLEQTAAQILAFYYPGTASGTTNGVMDVLVTADTSDDVVVRHRTGLTVMSVATGAATNLTKAGAQRWRIVADASIPGSRVDVLTDKWRPFTSVKGEAEFRAGGQPMRLYVPGGYAVYRGRLRSAYSAGQRHTVNVVHIEDYLRGVVPREMPATWHPNAVRAQAIAARSYAARERADAGSRFFDVWDTTRSQVYGGVGSEHEASDAAVKATVGQIRTYDGRPAFTQFSSSNGGWASKGSQPYLTSNEDKADLWAGNPNERWEVVVSATAIEKAYPLVGDFQKLQVLSRDGGGSWGGRVTQIRIVGAKSSGTVTGDQFRSALGLRSTMFVCPGGVASCPG